MLNPVFSPKHMRDLAPIFYPIAHQLRDLLTLRVKESDEEIDMSTWMSRAALEYIGQGGMGYEFDALDQNKTNKYHDAVKLFVYCPILCEPLAVADYPIAGLRSQSTTSSSNSFPIWSRLAARGSVERCSSSGRLKTSKKS